MGRESRNGRTVRFRPLHVVCTRMQEQAFTISVFPMTPNRSEWPDLSLKATVRRQSAPAALGRNPSTGVAGWLIDSARLGDANTRRRRAGTQQIR